MFIPFLFCLLLFKKPFQQNRQNEYTPDHTQTQFTFIAAFDRCIISSHIYELSSSHLFTSLVDLSAVCNQVEKNVPKLNFHIVPDDLYTQPTLLSAYYNVIVHIATKTLVNMLQSSSIVYIWKAV